MAAPERFRSDIGDVGVELSIQSARHENDARSVLRTLSLEALVDADLNDAADIAADITVRVEGFTV